jgi:L-threonylcarbamoyladenylate synthase
MLARHYSPRTPLECVEGGGRQRVETLVREGRRVGWVTHQAMAPAPRETLRRVLPADPAGYAAGLYAVLHELDAAGLDRIVVDFPPDSPDWLAVRDRLRRASS